MTTQTQEMETVFQLETGIPIPPRARGVGNKSPVRVALEKLFVAPHGASVFFQGAKSVTVSGIATAIGSGWYTTRTVDESGRKGIRVWRVRQEDKGTPLAKEAAAEASPAKGKGIIPRPKAQRPAEQAA